MGVLKKVVGKVLGIGDHDAEVNDYIASVNSLSGRRRKTGKGNTDDVSQFKSGTQSYGERDLIQIGNRLVQKLRAAGDDKNLRKVSNKVFMLSKRIRRR